ncbi:MAG: 5'-methylthioadenosine/S-adenosylhomocysteine nucleosidase [Clostridia bacterium]|nr:5'-methylthioadenosine/S-adenosylhomocysteine nucleosidase [Clostridia bacterium]
MRIGILCAGDRELAPFLPLLAETAVSGKAMLTFREGCLAGAEIVVVYSGVCKVNAAIAAQLLIDTYRCDAVINAGTAGAMDESLRVFDTVVCTEAAYHDVAEHILTGFHPWMADAYFRADTGLLAAARRAAEGLPQVRFGRMVTGEQFIADEGREHINVRFHPLSVDMETAAVAHVCHVNSVPFIAVRTMTDTPARRGTEAFEENCARASQITAEFVCRMLHVLKEEMI